ncbi:unnamed protein product, partial [Brassica oleracea var. botrytis]
RCCSFYQRTVDSTRQSEKPSCIISHRSSVDLTVKRFMRKGHLYPPVPSEEGEVHGKEGDVVEGNEYERVTVGVEYEDNSDNMAVKTYKWINNDYIKGELDFQI